MASPSSSPRFATVLAAKIHRELLVVAGFVAEEGASAELLMEVFLTEHSRHIFSECPSGPYFHRRFPVTVLRWQAAHALISLFSVAAVMFASGREKIGNKNGKPATSLNPKP